MTKRVEVNVTFANLTVKLLKCFDSLFIAKFGRLPVLFVQTSQEELNSSQWPLFCQRKIYSYFDKGCPKKSVEAYATMPIGIMGRKSLALTD